jgi:hypothetical protein
MTTLFPRRLPFQIHSQALGIALVLGAVPMVHGLVINSGASDLDNRRFFYGTRTINPDFLGYTYDLSGVSVKDLPTVAVPNPQYNGTATMIL